MIVFKCERAGCHNTHPYSPSFSQVAYDQLPATWVSYFAGRARDAEGYIFCSVDCLKKHLSVGESTQPLEQPQSKMRRFLLADGETTEEFEGVLWGCGQVTLTPENCGYVQRRVWASWEEFKEAHPGCGVTWIDQEVKEEVNNA